MNILDKEIQTSCDTALENLEDHYFLELYEWDQKKLDKHRENNKEKPEHRLELIHRYISHHYRHFKESLHQHRHKNWEEWQAWWEKHKPWMDTNGLYEDHDNPAKEPPYTPNFLLTADQIRMFLNQDGDNLRFYLKDTLEKQDQLLQQVIKIQKQSKDNHVYSEKEKDHEREKMKRLMRGSHLMGPLPMYAGMLTSGKKKNKKQVKPDKNQLTADIKTTPQLGVTKMILPESARLAGKEEFLPLVREAQNTLKNRAKHIAYDRDEKREELFKEHLSNCLLNKKVCNTIIPELNNIFKKAVTKKAWHNDWNEATDKASNLILSTTFWNSSAIQILKQSLASSISVALEETLDEAIMTAGGDILLFAENIANKIFEKPFVHTKKYNSSDSKIYINNIMYQQTKIENKNQHLVHLPPWERICEVTRLNSTSRFHTFMPTVLNSLQELMCDTNFYKNAKVEMQSSMAALTKDLIRYIEQEPTPEEEKEEEERERGEEERDPENYEEPEADEGDIWDIGDGSCGGQPSVVATLNPPKNNPTGATISAAYTATAGTGTPCDDIADAMEDEIADNTEKMAGDAAADGALDSAETAAGDAVVDSVEKKLEGTFAKAFAERCLPMLAGPEAQLLMIAGPILAPVIIHLLHSLFGHKPKKQSATLLMINGVSPTEKHDLTRKSDESEYEWYIDPTKRLPQRRKRPPQVVGQSYLSRPKDLFVQGWQKDFLNKTDKQAVSDLYIDSKHTKCVIQHFSETPPLTVAKTDTTWCALTGSLPMAKTIFPLNKETDPLKKRFQYRTPQLYTCSFLRTSISTDGVGGMAVFSIPNNGRYSKKDPLPDPNLKRRLAFSFHGQEGVNVKILQDDEQFDRKTLYSELEKGKKEKVEIDSDKHYYLHAKIANKDDHNFGVFIAMHKNSSLYRQWKEDEKLAPLFGT